MMQKYAFRMQLNPGMEAEYKRRHDEIWPELSALAGQKVQAMRLTHRRNNSTRTSGRFRNCFTGPPRFWRSSSRQWSSA